MELEEKREGDKVIYTITGRIDTNMAPVLQQGLHLDGVKEVIFDMEKVDYVFSAGLRVFLQAQKQMNSQNGTMKLINVHDSVKELFNIVGFTGIMDIE
ncbi:MAG: STAS domain-containing protein [Alphaproteobacteria bacterium]|nr:STAS domain-containing protein [Alphaproteobacteria bacterium]